MKLIDQIGLRITPLTIVVEGREQSRAVLPYALD